MNEQAIANVCSVYLYLSFRGCQNNIRKKYTFTIWFLRFNIISNVRIFSTKFEG